MIIFFLLSASLLLYGNSRYFEADWPRGMDIIARIPGLSVFCACIFLGLAFVFSAINFGIASALLLVLLGFTLFSSLLILSLQLWKRGFWVFVGIGFLSLFIEIVF